MTKPRFGKRLGFAAIMAVACRAFRSPQAQGRACAEAGQADQRRRRAVGGTQRHEGSRRQEGQERRHLSGHQRAAAVAAAERALQSGNRPGNVPAHHLERCPGRPAEEFIGKEISVKVDEVACAQDAGQMSEAVITKWERGDGEHKANQPKVRGERIACAYVRAQLPQTCHRTGPSEDLGRRKVFSRSNDIWIKLRKRLA